MSARPSRLVCAGCGREAPPEEPLRFRCAAAEEGDGGDHVLQRVLGLAQGPRARGDDPNPFVRFREHAHAYHSGRLLGLSDEAYVARVRALDEAVRAVDGRGFVETPYFQSTELARALGLAPGGVFVKDETGNVAGSHKARHLMGVALYLDVLEARGAAKVGPLAIASCGNAALGAAVVAAAARRPLTVFVPEAADLGVLARLAELGARIETCARQPGAPPGDPCVTRLRQAVRQGAVPFTCQGSENGLAIEGGETLALEMIAEHAALSPRPIDRLLVQVGGGALASACLQAFAEAWPRVPLPRVHAVQTRSAHPLERAWRQVVTAILARLAARESGVPGSGAGDAAAAAFIAARAGAAEVEDELVSAARCRSEYMRPWESEPRSVATGILDDETYDWLAVVRGMVESGGWPLVVSEERLLAARELARNATGVPVDATGSAGLAGLLELKAEGALAPQENVALLFTGRARGVAADCLGSGGGE